MRQAMTMGIVAAAGLGLTAVLTAQGGQGSATSPPALIIGASGNMTPIVGNLEEAARLYSDLVGLPSSPPIRRRSHNDVPYPDVLKNQGTPDATIRQVNLNIPGSAWRLEVLEFTDIGRKTVDARIQDPGATTLVLVVRDVDGLLAKLKPQKIQVVTPGGHPVPLTTGAGSARAVVVKTPDGQFVELQQPDSLPADPALPAGSVIGGRVRVTVADTDATLRLYRDQLAFRSDEGAFTGEASRLALMGTPGAQFRVASTTVPGAPQQTLEFIEFKGIDRKPLRTRIQDPGSAKIQLRVSDMSAVMAAFKTAGGTVVTTGGTYMIYAGVPTVIIRDMNNIFMNLQQQTQSPAAAAANR
jgi:catechol 2,3-dioxygenase-like lactoylglutathione lyase family enzyme